MTPEHFADYSNTFAQSLLRTVPSPILSLHKEYQFAVFDGFVTALATLVSSLPIEEQPGIYNKICVFLADYIDDFNETNMASELE